MNKKDYYKIQEQYEQLQQENKQLKEQMQNTYDTSQDLLSEMQQRIDKALYAYENFMSDEYILKILKGEGDNI